MRQLALRTFLIGLLICIFAIALFTRLHQLGSVPNGFFCDEASVGYNAYTVLTRGQDQYGSYSPIFFRAFGEYKSPMQIYSTVPLIALTGLSEWSVRATSVVWGMLSIIAIFFTTAELARSSRFKNSISLIAMTALAVSPWHIHFSRVSLEGFMPYLFFTLLGTYLFLRSLDRPRFFILATFSFTLAFYSYFPARIFVPLYSLGLCLIYIKHLRNHAKIVLFGFSIVLVLLVPFFLHIKTPEGLNRWKQVSIFTAESRKEPVLTHIGRNYIRHFSSAFLFTKGDIDMPGQFITRHSLRGMGELYWFQLPLLLLGLFSIARLKDRRVLYIVLLWLVLYPVGSMFTSDASPQATRSIIGVGIFSIIAGFGVAPILGLLRKNIIAHVLFWICLAGIIIASFYSFTTLYFSQYSLYAQDYWGWQFGARDIVREFEKQQNNYDDLIMSPNFNEPDIFLKFYSPQSCYNCRVGLPDDDYNPEKKQLYALTPDYIQSHNEYLYTNKFIIYYPNSTVAFLLAELRKK